MTVSSLNSRSLQTSTILENVLRLRETGPIDYKALTRESTLLIERILVDLASIDNDTFDNSKLDNSERDFWTYAFIGITKVIDYKCPAPMGVTFTKNAFHLFINPLLFHKSWTVEHIGNIVLHEGYHLLFDHITAFKNEFDNLDTRLAMNVATDCEINQRLSQLPAGCVTVESVDEYVGFKVNRLAGSRYYFDLIYKALQEQRQQEEQEQDKQESQNNSQDDSQGNSQDDSQSSDEQSNQSSQGSHSSDESQSMNLRDYFRRAKEQQTMQDLLQRLGEEHNKWLEGEDNYTTARNAAQELFNRASKQVQKSRGTVPNKLSELIEALNEPPQVSWQSHIKRSVGRQLKNKRLTMNRLNRRLPHMIQKKGKTNDYIKPIITAIDTSGSVSYEELAVYLNELRYIADKMHVPMTVIMFDADIAFIAEIDSLKDIPNQVFGRGGTSFQPVFDYLKENRIDKQAQLFFFTDGGGESQIDNHGYNHYKWFITEGCTLSVRDNDKPIIPIKVNTEV